MTKIETFAEQHRLKVTRDECTDRVIQGRRGQLYVDGAELCRMILDGPVRARSVLEAIGGKLWTGDKSPSEMHLYRGAPVVRSWSRYQETDKRISSMRREPTERLQKPLHRHRGPHQGVLPLWRPTDASPGLQPGESTVLVLHGNYHTAEAIW